jgi:acyl dehydratase
MKFFEDYEVGSIEKFGTCLVTREEVLDFARKFDPQPFHLSDEAAAQTHFGRLSASGWHTCGMMMRMIVEEFERVGHQGLGSPGIEHLRWVKPVYPGDTLRCERETLSARVSKSKPDMGIIRSRLRVFNQHDELVMEVEANDMIRVRNP